MYIGGAHDAKQACEDLRRRTLDNFLGCDHETSRVSAISYVRGANPVTMFPLAIALTYVFTRPLLSQGKPVSPVPSQNYARKRLDVALTRVNDAGSLRRC